MGEGVVRLGDIGWEDVVRVDGVCRQCVDPCWVMKASRL